MSEVRQTILKNDANTRQTVNSNKASGDVGSKKKSSNQKCKNSLPKNLRYDLENALVGLCDVWFEEIKPYLVRNNIKVHGDVGGGDLKRSSASPDCTHTDPASSATECKLCRLLFNAANSIESAVSQASNATAPCCAYREPIATESRI
ncbi:uncharacterized protein LOC124533995 isoform X2 [Vanessa cardui]|uniref:uncharacterized protein LOC124533995 isoform X2 n=1 Tax=Vanessa cardui TaxID=171605 RepID=UPI001F12A85E|nr:uncharacterized protein LOC124533995 isoform X2 [Vanessa cardui]